MVLNVSRVKLAYIVEILLRALSLLDSEASKDPKHYFFIIS